VARGDIVLPQRRTLSLQTVGLVLVAGLNMFHQTFYGFLIDLTRPIGNEMVQSRTLGVQKRQPRHVAFSFWYQSMFSLFHVSHELQILFQGTTLFGYGQTLEERAQTGCSCCDHIVWIGYHFHVPLGNANQHVHTIFGAVTRLGTGIASQPG